MLQQRLVNYKIILGSQSPRRQALLRELGIDFKIEVKSVEENYSNEFKREQITDFLVKKKAKAFDNLTSNTLLITSDTIVWFDEKPLEKPENREEAIQMLKALSGNVHEVITSVGVTSKDKQIVDHSITKVWFKELTINEIEFYVDHFNPLDKAGSYGIQEWIGHIGIEKIEGSYFNVMGLPSHLVYEILMNFDEKI